jgi:endonuclease YncB( thermonuclease family)
MIAAAFCLVIAVTDGDTLKVRCGEPGSYEQVVIRLAEIDAPEKRQPFGQRSRQSLADLCFQALATIKPQTQDRYGRTVARVECDGKDASAEQVRRGLAWFYIRYGNDAGIKALEGLARASNAGLWADPASVPPWQWRRDKR